MLINLQQLSVASPDTFKRPLKNLWADAVIHPCDGSLSERITDPAGRLGEYVIKRRHGEAVIGESDEDERKLMVDLVQRYGEFQNPSGENSAHVNGTSKDGEVVVGEYEGYVISQAHKDAKGSYRRDWRSRRTYT